MGSLLFLLTASAAWLQPAEGPRTFELVKADGGRQSFSTSYVGRISLLPTSFEGDRLTMERGQLRLLCTGACPASLPTRRPAEDVIYWRDGRRTQGFVAIYRGAVGQNGVRVGSLEEVERVELGISRAAPAQAASTRPGLIAISGGQLYHENPASGEYVVFREPWVTLTERSVIVQGREPVSRGEIRFIRHSGNRGGHFADPPVTEDLVVWRDGGRTSGRVLIRSGRVVQPGRPPRAFADVQYIELAPQR